MRVVDCCPHTAHSSSSLTSYDPKKQVTNKKKSKSLIARTNLQLYVPVASNILEHDCDSFFSLLSVSALPSKGTYTGSKLFRTSTPRSATLIFSSGRTIIFFKSDLES